VVQKLKLLAGSVVRELTGEVVSFDPDSVGVEFGKGSCDPMVTQKLQ
jgi:hypothetical protein